MELCMINGRCIIGVIWYHSNSYFKVNLNQKNLNLCEFIPKSQALVLYYFKTV